MRVLQMAIRLARLILPASLLVRHPSDADDLRAARQAAERANRVVDQWHQATEMQRAIHFETDFWRRHRG